MSTASKFAWLWPPSAPTIWLDHCPHWISKVGRFRPLSVSPNSHDYGIQVHLQTHSIMASGCISKFARSRGGKMVQLDGRQAMINILPQLVWHPKGILERQRFFLQERRKSERGYGGIYDHDEQHKLSGSMHAWQECMRDHRNWMELWKLGKSAWGTTQIAWTCESLARVCETKSWKRWRGYFV